MPGQETGGVGNFWYSFDYGNAHFISIDAETDIPNNMTIVASDIVDDHTYRTGTGKSLTTIVNGKQANCFMGL
jgi:hypothetical protein